MCSRTFIVTLQSSQNLPQFLNTVENWFLNPLTTQKICAVKILKEPLHGLRGRSTFKKKKKKNVATAFAIYMELDNREERIF